MMEPIPNTGNWGFPSPRVTYLLYIRLWLMNRCLYPVIYRVAPVSRIIRLLQCISLEKLYLIALAIIKGLINTVVDKL